MCYYIPSTFEEVLGWAESDLGQTFKHPQVCHQAVQANLESVIQSTAVVCISRKVTGYRKETMLLAWCRSKCSLSTNLSSFQFSHFTHILVSPQRSTSSTFIQSYRGQQAYLYLYLYAFSKVKVKVVSSVGLDECGRGDPFGVKLGRTGSCIRVWENQLEAYIYLYITATRLATLFP